MTPPEPVVVSPKGAARWRHGHPWIYRSDVVPVRRPPGIVTVADGRGRFLGQALWSPRSEISLRLLSVDPEPINRQWWTGRVVRAAARRVDLPGDPTAFRVVHGEGDGLPSLIVDRYGEYAVGQILSAGLETARDDIVAAIGEGLGVRGLLLRNDASVRRHEHLPVEVLDALGQVPDEIEAREGDIGYCASLRTGQKTGAFLDQRDNRLLMGSLARGRALDAFTYQGLFALHMARAGCEVLAVDSSVPALAAARRNADANALVGIELREANAFDLLRELEAARERFDTVVLDPPAFAKRKDAVSRALAGYKEINLRAMKLLAPGGTLFTASCSFHVGRGAFHAMLADAAADSGRRLSIQRVVGQSTDHPELINVPETGYLKGVVLRAED